MGTTDSWLSGPDGNKDVAKFYAMDRAQRVQYIRWNTDDWNVALLYPTLFQQKLQHGVETGHYPKGGTP
mgnify:FL=1